MVKIQNISSTVKTLRLQVASKEFSFLAGQWYGKRIFSPLVLFL